MEPLHRALRAWQLWQAWRTRRRVTEMAATVVLSPETTSTPTLSSYEQPKPSRSQLVQMPRRPSHRTLRARHVTHVLAVRFCGRGEVLTVGDIIREGAVYWLYCCDILCCWSLAECHGPSMLTLAFTHFPASGVEPGPELEPEPQSRL